jgi:hypothetical protein
LQEEDPEWFGLYHTRLGTKQGRTLWMTLIFVTISGSHFILQLLAGALSQIVVGPN